MANVLAVHRLTGIIAPVPEEYLEIYRDVLTKATEKQLKAAKDQAETEIYGAPLKDGVIPSGYETPAPKGETVVSKSEGGAANG